MSVPYGVNAAIECMRKGAVNHFPRDLLDTEPAAVLETLRSAARDHGAAELPCRGSTV